MAEKELRLTKRVDQTIWGRFISTMGRVFYSSNFSIYNLIVSIKRNAILKEFPIYEKSNLIADATKRDKAIERYQKAYSEYIDALEKYVKENVYAKVKNGTSTLEEQKIMTDLYGITTVKGTDHVDYKNKLHILLLNMDWSNVVAIKNDEYVKKYKAFYLYNIEELYRASMRHNAVLLANIKYDSKDVYSSIYKIIDTYVKDVLPISDEQSPNNIEIINQYKKHIASIDNYEGKKRNEYVKALLLLGFSGKLFKFSFPNVAREQCYIDIIKSLRVQLTNEYLDADKFATYGVLLDSIEEYVENILLIKTTWINPKEQLAFEKFNKKWEILKKLAKVDFESFKKQREVLFIKYDLFVMDRSNIKLPEVRAYYKERMVILHALREIKNKVATISGVWVPFRKAKNTKIEQENNKNVENSQETAYNIENLESDKLEETNTIEDNTISDNSEETTTAENLEKTTSSDNKETIMYISNITGTKDISNIIDYEKLINSSEIINSTVETNTDNSDYITYNTEIGKITMPSSICADSVEIKNDEQSQNQKIDNNYSFRFDNICPDETNTDISNTNTQDYKKFGFDNSNNTEF